MQIEQYEKIKSMLRYAIAGTEWEGHVYTVGGCERDRLSGREIKDIDIVIDLPNGGIRFAKWLEEKGLTNGTVVVYENFGTAMFHLSEMPAIEIEAVQTRKECYRDISTRNPETAYGTIEEDCQRRDFTYNAIYFDITNNETKDFSGRGIADLNSNTLRACGNPEIIFNEDPLRILRAVRFATRFNSKIDIDTLGGMYVLSHRLDIISKERIKDELFKILVCKGAKSGLELIFNLGMTPYVIPQLARQNRAPLLKRAERWDEYEIDSVELRLASLLYDVNATDALMFLKCSNETINSVEKFKTISKDMQDAANKGYQLPHIRKIQYSCKNPIIFNEAVMVLEFVTGDKNMSQALVYNSVKTEMGNTSMFNYTLPITGNDIMELMNIPPSKEVGEYLSHAMEYVYQYPSSTKEEILAHIKELK